MNSEEAMEELIDVLDEKGEKTGRTATRAEVHAKGFWHKIAVVAVLDDKNHILLQQRSKDKVTNPNKWDISAAGHVEAGENALTSAVRETAEEVGIKAEADKFQFLLSYQKISHHKYKGAEIVDKQIFDCFILRVSEKDAQHITLQAAEVQAAGFFSIDEFKKMLADGVMVNQKPVYDAILNILGV